MSYLCVIHVRHAALAYLCCCVQPLPLSPVFSTDSDQPQEILSPGLLDFTQFADHFEAEFGQRTISHKRTSFFDFMDSCNRLPANADDGLLPPVHIRQTSSSWGGVTSPIALDAGDEQEGAYEFMQPQHNLHQPVMMMASTGNNVPALTQSRSDSCPNLASELQSHCTPAGKSQLQPLKSALTLPGRSSQADSGRDSSSTVGQSDVRKGFNRLELQLPTCKSNSNGAFSPPYICESSSSEAGTHLGTIGYFPKESTATETSEDSSSDEDSDDSAHEHNDDSQDYNDDLPVFSSGGNSPVVACAPKLPDVQNIDEDYVVKELDTMMASLSDLLSGLSDCDSSDDEVGQHGKAAVNDSTSV